MYTFTHALSKSKVLNQKRHKKNRGPEVVLEIPAKTTPIGSTETVSPRVYTDSETCTLYGDVSPKVFNYSLPLYGRSPRVRGPDPGPVRRDRTPVS